MDLIDWSDGLSVKNVELDGQHKKIISLINELHFALLKGKSSDILDEILADLLMYTQVHFSAEEEMFEQLDYPGAEAHKAKHREFEDKISSFKLDHKKQRVALSIDVMEYLVSWFLRHIQRVDQEYVKIQAGK